MDLDSEWDPIFGRTAVVLSLPQPWTDSLSNRSEWPILRLLAPLSKGCFRVGGKACRQNRAHVREHVDCVKVAARATLRKNLLARATWIVQKMFAERNRESASSRALRKRRVSMCAARLADFRRRENARRQCDDPTFRSRYCDTYAAPAHLSRLRPTRFARRPTERPAIAHVA
jgi:hypothetical protein